MTDGRFHFIKNGNVIANIMMHNHSVCLRKCFQGFHSYHEANFWLFTALKLKEKIQKTIAIMIRDGTLQESERYEKRKCVLPGESKCKFCNDTKIITSESSYERITITCPYCIEKKS